VLSFLLVWRAIRVVFCGSVGFACRTFAITSVAVKDGQYDNAKWVVSDACMPPALAASLQESTYVWASCTYQVMYPTTPISMETMERETQREQTKEGMKTRAMMIMTSAVTSTH